VRVSAKADYAIRATLELAAAEGRSLKSHEVAEAQGIPGGFLDNILLALRHANIVGSQRGSDGGYWLARPANEITVADVLRAVEGRISSVRGQPPDELSFEGAARPLGEVWMAARASLRRVLEGVTFADLVRNELPTEVTFLARDSDA